MLQNTFIHIPGIGIKSEQALWEKGIRSWDDFLAAEDTGSSKKKTERMKDSIRSSQEQFQKGNAAYFAERLPPNQYWRFFPEFRERTAYLDVVATDLDPWMHSIPVITLFNGMEIMTYVQGKNLDDFLQDIQKYSTIITYSGTRIGLPFIRINMGLELQLAHIDLQYTLQGLGFKGGQQGAEKMIGIDRGKLNNLDGFAGLLLWEDFRDNKNEKALETLKAISTFDAVALETLMVQAYNLKVKQTPFGDINQLRPPVFPEIPYKADVETISDLNWTSLMDRGNQYTDHPGFYYSRGLI